MLIPKKRSTKIGLTEITTTDSHDIIKKLRVAAYFNWINAGRPDGRAVEFWCQAERDMFGWTMGEFEVSVKEMNDRMIENMKRKEEPNGSITCG